jgi:hypothetical protein
LSVGLADEEKEIFEKRCPCPVKFIRVITLLITGFNAVDGKRAESVTDTGKEDLPNARDDREQTR